MEVGNSSGGHALGVAVCLLGVGNATILAAKCRKLDALKGNISLTAMG